MDWLKLLEEKNPDALLFEPREVYDPCIIGVESSHPDDWWEDTRDPEAPPVAVYDYDLLRAAFLKLADDDATEEEAEEFIDFNMAGAWVGNGTPIIVSQFRDEETEEVSLSE
jgi:hypothetical protein